MAPVGPIRRLAIFFSSTPIIIVCLFANAIEVIAIDLAELRIEAAIVGRPDLIETGVFILVAEADVQVLRALPLFSRGGGDQVKPMRQLPHDNQRAREPVALAVDLRPDVLTEGSPPQISLGDERQGAAGTHNRVFSHRPRIDARVSLCIGSAVKHKSVARHSTT
jgi:hypothetical protein